MARITADTGMDFVERMALPALFFLTRRNYDLVRADTRSQRARWQIANGTVGESLMTRPARETRTNERPPPQTPPSAPRCAAGACCTA
jgi:hypothetical protein